MEGKMLTNPTIFIREPMSFAAMLITVKQPEIGIVAPPLVDQVISWIERRGGEVAGRSFFNYPRCFSDGRMEIVVGVPTQDLLEADDEALTGTLPGGRYASLTANVPYDHLHHANRVLGDWAQREGYAPEGQAANGGWVGRTQLEIYHLDAHEHPSGLPVTEIAVKLRG
jgi:hypothetical protein